MLTNELIKEKAKELGATVCGIGAIYDESNPQRDPKSILPKAKCIIGFAFAGGIVGVGLGTVVAALGTGRVIALLNRLCGKQMKDAAGL